MMEEYSHIFEEFADVRAPENAVFRRFMTREHGIPSHGALSGLLYALERAPWQDKFMLNLIQAAIPA